jgi:hypothetical protein
MLMEMKTPYSRDRIINHSVNLKEHLLVDKVKISNWMHVEPKVAKQLRFRNQNSLVCSEREINVSNSVSFSGAYSPYIAQVKPPAKPLVPSHIVMTPTAPDRV